MTRTFSFQLILVLRHVMILLPQRKHAKKKTAPSHQDGCGSERGENLICRDITGQCESYGRGQHGENNLSRPVRGIFCRMLRSSIFGNKQTGKTRKQSVCLFVLVVKSTYSTKDQVMVKKTNSSLFGPMSFFTQRQKELNTNESTKMV